MAHRQHPKVELQAVKEELELAKKTIDRYAHLVAKLYDELDTLRNSVCKTCKKNFFVSGATTSSSVGRSSSPSRGPSASPTVPLWRRVFRGHPAQPQNNESGRRQVQAVSDFRSAETSSTSSSNRVSFEPTLAPLPATQPQTVEAVDNIATSPLAKPDEADWSVVYNDEVKQTLDVQLAHTFKMKAVVYCVKFSRDGRYLAVGLNAGETYVYDMKTLSNRVLTIVEYPAKTKPSVWDVQFSPDDKCVATGGSDGRVKIWNIAKRHVVAAFKGHTAEVFSVAFSPDGRFLVSSSFDGSVRIWRTRDGSSRELLATKMPLSSFTSVAISPDGRYVAAANEDGLLRICNFRTGQLLERWGPKGDARGLWSVVFTPDGKGLLSGGLEGILRSWDVSSLMTNQSVSRKGAPYGGNIDEEKENLTFHGHSTTVFYISFLPDSRWVLSGSGDSGLRIWDARTGAWQCILNGHQAAGAAADASPDGLHLATGGHDRLVRIWRYEQV